MENRATIQELAELLSLKAHIQKSKALRVAQAVFGVIDDGLRADGFVKVRGLGTFKIVQQASRESVSVQTGERIVIGEHSRLCFTADVKFKERVNRPFESFQTIMIDDAAETEQPAPQREGEIDSSPMDAAQEVRTIELAETTASNLEIKTIVLDSAAPPESAPSDEGEGEDREPDAERGAEAVGHVWRWMGLCAIGLCLLAAGYVAGYYKILSPVSSQQVEESSDGQAAAECIEDTSLLCTEGVKTAETAQEPAAETMARDYPQVDGGEYWIVGVVSEHVVQPGEGLYRLTRQVWNWDGYLRYVMVMNGIENPDLVAVGQLIKFPKLVLREPAE